jgi:hypothetical protein
LPATQKSPRFGQQRFAAMNEEGRMTTLRACEIAIAAILITGALLSPGTAAPIFFEDSGVNAAAIQDTVDNFRAALGAPNNGNAPGPLPSGRREINWDGGGQATTVSPTPFAGFLNIRGALLTTPGTGFVQAPPSGLATLFSNPTYNGFGTFSDPRLFGPINSTLTTVDFFVPGTNGGIPATVTGFGAVFSDVDTATGASLTFLNSGGAALGPFFASPANNGLSFFGALFPGEQISQVQIVSGNVPFGPSEFGAIDIIAMDDFLYSELSPIPEPTTLLLLGTTAAGLGLARWRQRRRTQRALL